MSVWAILGMIAIALGIGFANRHAVRAAAAQQGARQLLMRSGPPIARKARMFTG